MCSIPSMTPTQYRYNNLARMVEGSNPNAAAEFRSRGEAAAARQAGRTGPRKASAQRPGANIEAEVIGGETILGGIPRSSSTTDDTTPSFGKTLLGQ